MLPIHQGRPLNQLTARFVVVGIRILILYPYTSDSFDGRLTDRLVAGLWQACGMDDKDGFEKLRIATEKQLEQLRLEEGNLGTGEETVEQTSVSTIVEHKIPEGMSQPNIPKKDTTDEAKEEPLERMSTELPISRLRLDKG